MCGIAGLIAIGEHTGGPTEQAALAAMTRAVRHRGPDDLGLAFGGLADSRVTTLDAACADAACAQVAVESRSGGGAGPDHGDPSPHAPWTWGLGHTRLAILDLSARGHQPMRDPAEDLWLVYNGEVYNHLDLRPELEAAGCRFRSTCDTETVLHAYRVWGEACVERFVGMYAFLGIDRRRGRGFVARDRFGIKPLYLYAGGGWLAVASELKQLRYAPGFRGRARLDLLADFLRYGVMGHDEPHCCFDGVLALPAAHTLSWRLGSAPRIEDARRYWTPSLATIDRSAEEATAALRERFEAAVHARMLADVPVGSCLSGGMDSSSIVGVAARGRSEPLQAVSACWPEQACDETEYVEAVARHTGCRVHFVRPTEAELLEALEGTARTQDEPISSLSVAAQWLVFRAARTVGIPVMLDGQCGDETLCGYNKFAFFHLLERLRRGRLDQALPLMLKLWLFGDGRLFDLARGRRYLARWLGDGGGGTDRADGVGGMGAWLREPLREAGTGAWTQHLATRADVHERQWADLTRWSLPLLLRYEDRNGMAHAVESRLPFTDHRLVELCLGLPPRLFFLGGRTKRLLARAVGDALPEAVRRRRTKLGFETPQASMMRGRLGTLLEEAVASCAALEEWIDVAAVRQAFAAYRAGRRGIRDGDLFRVASVAMWRQVNDVTP